MLSFLRIIIFLGLILGLGSAVFTPAFAEDNSAYEYWPGAIYDQKIPTTQQVLGFKIGEEITSHAEMIRYFTALEKAAPDRLKIKIYGKTWEGRDLIYVAISSKNNIKNLDVMSRDMKRLADPRTLNDKQAQKIIRQMVGSTWLAYSVHGNEISPMDAAMQTAYHLLAAQNQPQTDKIMKDSVVFIDPLQNPDGRDRFIHNYRTARGLQADSSTSSAEHNEPWPGGRTNHYLFDMNRDWFALTQPETEGRIKALQEFFPIVFVDLHEMGGNSSYYFAPEAVPFNPHLAKDQRASLELFGKNNAKYFDQYGFDYFTREIFDAFYPGYGASWPSYYGSVAMTYEQASSRGLRFRRNDGTTLHYRDTVRHHFVASISTAEVTAVNRIQLLNEFYSYRKTAILEGKKEKRRYYIIPAQQDQAAATKIAGLLTKQGVEVKKSLASFKICGKNYKSGSLIIDSAQPSKRFIRTVMEDQVEMEKQFLKEQERRRAKDLSDQIYDVTAWSLPHMFNVKVDRCGKIPRVKTVKAGAEYHGSGSVKNPEATVAFLVPWGQSTSSRLLSHALRQGLKVKSSDQPFTSLGKKYPSGSLIFEVKSNDAGLSEKLQKIAQITGAQVTGVNDSWITKGPNFGSENVVKMNPPHVAILWDKPTSSYSAGNTRYVIERQFDYPVTAIRGSSLSYINLSQFHVLILPEGRNYKKFFGKSGTQKIKDWVSKGGVLIALGSAVRYVSDPEVNLLALRREYAVKTHEKKEEEEKEKSRVKGTLLTSTEDFNKAIDPIKESPDVVSGVMLRAKVDSEHWLAAGVKKELNILYRGSDIYTPMPLDKGMNVARFLGENDLLLSGYLWKENRSQLAYKPFAAVQRRGRGQVIGFTSDPTVRAYLDGLNLMLMNAIFRGAAHASPLR